MFGEHLVLKNASSVESYSDKRQLAGSTDALLSNHNHGKLPIKTMNNALPTWQPLWSDSAPGALGTTENDTPALRYYPPAGHSMPGAILVLPGGGYSSLAPYEGEGYARWLSSIGFHAFELRYRLSSHGYRHPSMWLDASRALRLVRSKAIKLGFATQKVAVIGSSAGGHLASYLSVKNDHGTPHSEDLVERYSSRPDATILCYPVISMVEDCAHTGSRENLLGAEACAAQYAEVSPELLVTEYTPPAFLWHTMEDAVVDSMNSVIYAFALKNRGVPVEVHLYAKGPHGIGLANGHPWTAACERWLNEVLIGLDT